MKTVLDLIVSHAISALRAREALAGIRFTDDPRYRERLTAADVAFEGLIVACETTKLPGYAGVTPTIALVEVGRRYQAMMAHQRRLNAILRVRGLKDSARNSRLHNRLHERLWSSLYDAGYRHAGQEVTA